MSPNGRTVLTGLGQFAALWDGVTGKPLGPARNKDWLVRRVTFSPDGKTFLVQYAKPGGGSAGTAQKCDGETGRFMSRVFEINQTGSDPKFCVLSEAGDTLLTGTSGPEVWVWNLAQGSSFKPVHKLSSLDSAPVFAAFGPEGRTVVTGSGNGQILLWDLNTLELISKPMRHLGVQGVAFSADGARLVTWGRNQAQVWQVSSGQPVGAPLEHRDSVTAATFGPEGRTVLTVQAHEVRLWPATFSATERGEGITLWVQLLTGLELEEIGPAKKLDAAARQQCRQRFEKIIGLAGK